jgi:hypothetical protein
MTAFGVDTMQSLVGPSIVRYTRTNYRPQVLLPFPRSVQGNAEQYLLCHSYNLQHEYAEAAGPTPILVI